MDVEKHEHLRSLEPIEVWVIYTNPETGETEEILKETIDKSFIPKIAIKPDYPEEDTADVNMLLLHVGQLLAMAERFAFYREKNLARFEARTRRKAKVDNPKMTIQALADLVIDTPEHERLSNLRADADMTVAKLKNLVNTVRMKADMLKTRGFNKL